MQRTKKIVKILCGALVLFVLSVSGFSACKKKVGIADLFDFA